MKLFKAQWTNGQTVSRRQSGKDGYIYKYEKYTTGSPWSRDVHII